jgi:hypothetical protein
LGFVEKTLGKSLNTLNIFGRPLSKFISAKFAQKFSNIFNRPPRQRMDSWIEIEAVRGFAQNPEHPEHAVEICGEVSPAT